MSRRKEIGAMNSDYPARTLGRNSSQTMVKLIFWLIVCFVWYFANKYVVFGLFDVVIPENGYREAMLGTLKAQDAAFIGGSLVWLFLVLRSNIGR